MKTIRQNVFETNSSSMHSFTIAREPIESKNNETITLTSSGDYGWSGPPVNSPADLLDYACVAFSYIAKNKLDFIDTIDNVIAYFKTRGVTVINDAKYISEKEYEYDYRNVEGSIDHQSAPYEDSECDEIAHMFYEPEKLYNFVFGKSEIIIDNDNH